METEIHLNRLIDFSDYLIDRFAMPAIPVWNRNKPGAVSPAVEIALNDQFIVLTIADQWTAIRAATRPSGSAARARDSMNTL